MFRTLRAKLIATYVGIAVLCLVLALGILLLLARDYALRNGFKTLDEKKALALPYIRLVIEGEMKPDDIKGSRLSNGARESIRSSGLRVLLLDPGTMEVMLDTSARYNAEGQTFNLDDEEGSAFYQQLARGEVRETGLLPGGGGPYQYVAQRIRQLPGSGGRNVREMIVGALILGENDPATGEEDTEGAEERAPINKIGRAALAPIAPYIAIIAQPQPQLGTLLNDVREYITPAILIALAISFLAAYLLGRQISRPVARLAIAARAVGRGDYSQQVPVHGNDELATLTQQFNEMASEVGRAHQIQRDFVANVSHDLKTPLTSIQGFSQAILDGATKTQADYRQAASIINTEAQRMNRMVTELLSLASLQNGLSSLDMRPVQIAPVLSQLVLTMQPQAEQSGVTLAARFNSANALVLADVDRLKQAFANLIENALKYTSEGGRVTLILEDVQGGVSVQIEDTGKGIPEHDLKRVTERFYQVDKSRSAADGNSLGLGLAIAQEIIHAHGGQIGVTSKEGIGTTVRVTLPAQTGKQTGVMQKADASRQKAVDSKVAIARVGSSANGNGYSNGSYSTTSNGSGTGTGNGHSQPNAVGEAAEASKVSRN